MTSGRPIQRLIFHSNKYFEKNKKNGGKFKNGFKFEIRSQFRFFTSSEKKVTDSIFAEPDTEMDPKLGSQLVGKLQGLAP